MRFSLGFPARLGYGSDNRPGDRAGEPRVLSGRYDPDGRSIESKVLAAAVKAHAEDRIIDFKGRTIVFG